MSACRKQRESMEKRGWIVKEKRGYRGKKRRREAGGKFASHSPHPQGEAPPPLQPQGQRWQGCPGAALQPQGEGPPTAVCRATGV